MSNLGKRSTQKVKQYKSPEDGSELVLAFKTLQATTVMIECLLSQTGCAGVKQTEKRKVILSPENVLFMTVSGHNLETLGRTKT